MSDHGDTSKRRGHKSRGSLPPASPPARDEPLVLSLRDVELPPVPAPETAPTDEELVLSDHELQPEPWLGDPDAERAEQRAARRAEVRRARLRDAAATPEAPVAPEAPAATEAPAASEAPAAPEAPAATKAPTAPEVLVLSAVDASASPLCGLLKKFGFGVRVLREPPALPAPWPFVAVFVDFALGTADDGDAIGICNEVREQSRLPGERKPVLLLVADQLSSTDRVRAGLAGCNEIIVGDVTRGSVASALDSRGVALPSDARRL